MKPFTIFPALMLLVVASATGSNLPVPGTKAPDFKLQDQYDKTIDLREFKGRVVVLIACDKKGKTQNPAWVKAISEKYGSRIVIMGVADLRGVPFFLKNKVKNDIKKDFIDRVLLDWNGEIFAAYGLAEGVPNIIVIDINGVITHVQAGPAHPDAVQRLFVEIDKLERQ